MKTNNFTEHYEKLENYLLGMGQDTLGDHMHIQSIRSRHRACNMFPPLLDALLINARTIPALIYIYIYTCIYIYIYG